MPGMPGTGIKVEQELPMWGMLMRGKSTGRRLADIFSVIGVGTVVCLGLLATNGLYKSFDGMRSLLSPFSSFTRVTPTGPVVLEQMQRLHRLESCRYNGQVIVRGDSSGPLPTWLIGDRILFVGHGEVIAGIDLSKLRNEDVQVKDTTVSLNLPVAEILSTRLDNRQSQVFDRQTGLFNKPNKDLESQVRAEAEENIKQAALSNHVLQTARENAQAALRSQLTQLGFTEVKFL